MDLEGALPPPPVSMTTPSTRVSFNLSHFDTNNACAAIQGYNSNTYDPPLRYGDTVTLVVHDWNALVAFSGADDARPWIEVLDDQAGVPPNLEACVWRLEPQQRHEMRKKLKQFLKVTQWDQGKGLPLPDPPQKHVNMGIQVADYMEEKNLSEEAHDGVRELFDLLGMIEDERELLISEQERVRGKVLTYGSGVVLVHDETGTVLSTKKERALEHDSKRVFMDPHGNNQSNFTIRPAYRTYADGSAISAGDMVQFETRSTISGVRYKLHMAEDKTCSEDADIVRRQLTCDHHYIVGGQELNAMADEPTFFRLLLFQSYKTKYESPDVIKGNGVFTLYHKQAGGYLHYDPHLSEKPFFYESKRVSGRDRKKAAWLWTVENSQVFCGGEAISSSANSRQRFRIKHLITDMYMIKKNGDMFMTRDYQAMDTLFSFRSFSKDVYNDHVLNSKDLVFMRTNEGEYLTQADPSDTKSSFGASQLPKKDLNRRIQHVRMRELESLPDADALLITPVQPSVVHAIDEIRIMLNLLYDLKEQFELMKDCAPGTNVDVERETNTVKGAVDGIRSSSTAFMDKSVDAEGAEGVIEVLHNCLEHVEPVLTRLVLNLTHGVDQNPMARDGQPNKVLQKLLRELKVIPLIVSLIQLPFKKGVDINRIAGAMFYSPLVRFLNLSYRLLKQIAQKNIRNCKILFESLSIFRSQLGKGILITPTIKEIFENKRELLNMVSRDIIDDFIELLKKDKAPQYIDFLMSMCTSGVDSDPQPVVGVQTMITQALLEENSDLLPKVSVQKDSKLGLTESANTFRGMLQKRGHVNTHFQKRYFVLESGVLTYYKIPDRVAPEEYVKLKSSRPQGMISCNGLEVHSKLFDPAAVGAHTSEEHTFTLTEKSGRRIVCKSENGSTRMAWLSVLQEVTKAAPNQHTCSVHVSLAGTSFTMNTFHKPKKVGDKEWDYLAWIMHAELAGLSKEERMARYYVRCTNLYGRLALGRNQAALRSLIGNKNLSLSYNQIMIVIQDDGLPYLLRARYTSLMTRLYVDRDPQIMTQTITSTRVWNEVTADPSDFDMTVKGAGGTIPVCTNGFVDLQLYLVRSLPRLADCKDNASDTSLNGKPTLGQLEFIKTSLILCDILFDFGFFSHDTETQTHFFRTIFTMIDSRDPIFAKRPEAEDHGNTYRMEKLRHKVLEQRLASDKASVMLSKVREYALRFFQRLWEIRLNNRITFCVDAWESMFENIRMGRGGGLKALLTKPNNIMSVTAMSSLPSPTSNEPNSKGVEKFDVQQLQNIFMEFTPVFGQLQENMFSYNIISPPEIGSDVYRARDFKDSTLQVLLELCTFKYQPMSQLAISLVIRHMSQQSVLLTRLQSVQILVYPEAARVLNETQFIIKRMSSLQKMIADEDPVAYCELSGLLQRMIHEVTVRVGNKPEIVTKNQSILLNLGVHKQVQRLLALYLARDTSRRDRGELEADIPGSAMRRDLFQDCYDVLRAVVKNNPRVQATLFPHMDTFAEHIGIEKLNVADTISEIVKDNAKLCARVSEKFLEVFINAIRTWGRRARWLTFFQSLMLLKGKQPVKRLQDIILRLLLDHRDAVLDLTCDYRASQYLSRNDQRYGNDRVQLLLDNDHKRKVFSLLKYHVSSLKTLAMCAFGRNATSQLKISFLVSAETVVENILDVDVRQDGSVVQGIDPDAIRYVQVGWISLLTDVYFTCNDTMILKKVALLKRIWANAAQPGMRSLFTLFGTALSHLNVRIKRLNAADYMGHSELFDNLADEYGHDLGSHFHLVEEVVRSCLVFCTKWTSFVKTDSPPTKELKILRDNAVQLYYDLEDFKFSNLSHTLVEFITSTSKLDLGSHAAKFNVKPEKEILVSEEVTPQEAFLEGWQKFKQYLSLMLTGSFDVGNTMDKAIQDIALVLGSTETHMNEDLQNLHEFTKVICNPQCDDVLRLLGIKAIRAIIYMNPGQEPHSPATFDAEYQLHLDNRPCGAVGTYKHEHWQARVAQLGAVDVAVECSMHSDLEIVDAALQLAVSLLDGGNTEVQRMFTAIMLPTSSAPFFKRLFKLFEDSQEEIRETKRRHKQAAAETAALAKAGICAREKENEEDLQLVRGQRHMKEAMLMMQRMCLGDSDLDDVLRVQKLNHESFNFFDQTELYVEAIEPELRDAFYRNDFEMVEAAICGLNLLTDGMHGPNYENQKVIADTGIYDLCDRIFARIKFEHRKSGKQANVYVDENGKEHILTNDDDEMRVQRNIMRSNLRFAALSCLDGFLEAVDDLQFINQMLVQLNWDGLVTQLKECYELYHAGNSLKGYDVPQELSLKEGLGYYFMMIHIRKYDKKKEWIAPKLELCPSKILAFFEAHTGYIEIVRDARLERVYFQIPENCLKGGPMDKPNLDTKLYDADRSNFEKKPQAFVENMCALVEEEQFRQTIRHSNLAFTVTKVDLVRSINFLWILTMHLSMLFGSYMPSHGFWLKSFEETFEARIDQQWYGITPWGSKEDDATYGYDYGDNDDAPDVSSEIRRMGRRHGGHHSQHKRVLERMEREIEKRAARRAEEDSLTRQAQEDLMTRRTGSGSGRAGSGSGWGWGSGWGLGEELGSGSSSGSGSSGSGSATSGSGSGSAGYECTYDNYCSYSNGDGGGYGRKHGWAFAFNLTVTDVHFYRHVLPTLRWVVRVMSWINLFTCGLRFFAFIWAELPMIVWRTIEEEDNANRGLPDQVEQAVEEHASDDGDDLDIIWIAEHTRKKKFEIPVDDKDTEDSAKDYKWALSKRQIWVVLTNSSVWYETAFVVFPLIAVCADEPLYSAYSLLEMCFWDSSRPVTDAVTKNLGKVFTLIIVALLYMYIELLFGMMTIKDALWREVCMNMFQCMQSMTDITIRDYGVFDMLGYVEDYYRYPSNVIDALGIDEPMRKSGVYMIKKNVWDITFQMFFAYVLISMVCGIIVDAFSTLKSEEEADEKDLDTVCFVCNLERWQLDQEGLGFDRHIKDEHNPRMYLYFLVHLKRKRYSDLTGQERHVYDEVWPENGASLTSWIPRDDTFSLKHHFDTMERETVQISNHLKDIHGSMDKGCDMLERFEARLEMVQYKLSKTRTE